MKKKYLILPYLSAAMLLFTGCANCASCALARNCINLSCPGIFALNGKRKILRKVPADPLRQKVNPGYV